MRKTSLALTVVGFLAVGQMAFGNVAATLTRAQTAVKTTGATTSRAFSGLSEGVITAVVTNSAAQSALTEVSEKMESIATSNEDVENNMSKEQRITYLADMYALLAKSGSENVAKLVKGKPLKAIVAPETLSDEEQLNSSNIEKFHQIVIAALENDDVTEEALENASKEVTGYTFAQVVDACGSGSAGSGR